MKPSTERNPSTTRRELLRGALGGLSLQMTRGLGLPLLFGQAALANAGEPRDPNRILVIFEMSGGNDGLNTVVPYGDDTYYRLRPRIGIKPNKVRKLDQHFGLSPGMVGFERLYKEGRLAIVHGCGYDNPSFSHFTSMAYWHTAAPNSGEEYGWVGRLADAIDPDATPNYVVNVDTTQSLAVQSRLHTPVVFDDPERFARNTLYDEKPMLDKVAEIEPGMSASRRYLLDVARSAQDASALVRRAWANYRSPIDYGLVPLNLPKVAALIEAGMPARLYYVAFRNNAFDTHVQQADLHQRLLTYTSDAVYGFMRDMERIGRADDVTMLIFSEFGRRVPENTSLGTDHGAANTMFLVGKPVKGGHYGEVPSLDKLDAGDNLVYTTDFRRVYATAMQGWLGASDTRAVLRGEFAPFPAYA
ncbi:MAG TPA: DUF1501 domain-containing protein [Burkholderiales bacterium]|nr:DUF1501 domain-containing protein [Burkholderiales bacterium]